MSPRTDIPPASVVRWEDLVALIKSKAGFEPFIDDLTRRLPLPSGKKRQRSRILEWFGPTLPSAPIAMEIVATALRCKMITRTELYVILKSGTPFNTQPEK